MATPYGSANKRGSLMVVGSGIKCVGQITLEAKGWIEQADHVLYLVTDPATEIWIKQTNKNNTNLSLEYKAGRTSDQIAGAIVETILEKVTEGQDVCAVFYGHPGVAAGTSGEVIKRAQKAGYRAAMLPGISSVDCLMADLEVDLQVDLVEEGCQMFTALDFMQRGLKLDTRCHVVFMKIATPGGRTFYSRSPDGHAFPDLVTELIRLYGQDHEVVLYQASKYPTCPPLICRLNLGQQLVAEVEKDTSNALTLYIPPKPATAAEPANAAEAEPKNYQQGAGASFEEEGYYYQPSRDTSQVATYLAELSQHPLQLADFNRARNLLTMPPATLNEKPWLNEDVSSILQEYRRKFTPQERDALLSSTDRANNLYRAMQEPSPKKAVGAYTAEGDAQNPMKNKGELQAAVPPKDPSGYKDLTQGSDSSPIPWIPRQ